ncbi:uncharacterized protein EV420DRAFT_1751735 [Desarmillaria tabescens]|uniref:Uncharacterized protein n=1 Tax=Armillaria tabescens TaxID=1929756 RepID=A0AA39MRP1_ARMTA|nr:uncharacterized protein EV420DRAFT_1751735 [Desarmillaria tabescens]KAK0444586.1 hypothetical protein EV420DRAFT_1751735 [Desarmillaria tabescens]
MTPLRITAVQKEERYEMAHQTCASVMTVKEHVNKCEIRNGKVRRGAWTMGCMESYKSAAMRRYRVQWEHTNHPPRNEELQTVGTECKHQVRSFAKDTTCGRNNRAPLHRCYRIIECEWSQTSKVVMQLNPRAMVANSCCGPKADHREAGRSSHNLTFLLALVVDILRLLPHVENIWPVSLVTALAITLNSSKVLLGILLGAGIIIDEQHEGGQWIIGGAATDAQKANVQYSEDINKEETIVAG